MAKTQIESILNSVKKALGIEAEYDHFDPELIMFINSAFGVCYQLGVGPTDKPFIIEDAKATWDEFIQGDQIETIKTYIFAKVKLIFDPPTSSSVLQAYQELIKEFEWRSNVDAETP